MVGLKCYIYVLHLLGEKGCKNILQQAVIGSANFEQKRKPLLDNFGDFELNEDIIGAAEEYLISVLKGKETSLKIFAEYMYYQFVKCGTP